ncbi:hypothetical protein HKCCE3408_09510 [Rhodobacterales bacterium HKCCE3408]|nr:hypothetical protein [Rhodobacterales bacterium HKCCE3408]
MSRIDKTTKHRSKFDLLPKDVRDASVRDIVLGRRSMFQVTKDLNERKDFSITDTSVARYMSTVTEDERLEIIATAMGEAKMIAIAEHAQIVDEFGEDTDKDLKWVLRELKDLLRAAKDDEDRAMQLGSLKELRQALMSLADLHGKLNKRMDIHLNLNESPQFIQLRQIILNVLERQPDAKADFLEEMKVLKVLEHPALP